ncbi:AAA family ATPase [Hoeflea poritis]|uniref:AAA family ATPase n=1 Tax=Hoeflea poritis TaxID=2993659 RepID=A0ABT4VVU9_9HYPH|nr:AAA family ATPase [Hoeflea poritis]MDA4848847.1 AAA family ATPase [Hoeflea poritis]
MKIRSIAVNQFKKFTTPMCLDDIGDGLNVVVGPNEMGKSTLLDALKAALFEKYSSKAQPIVALQNDRNQAAPVVELAFEVDDGIYRIRKRFVKKPYAHLFCPDGRNLEGDEAEVTLRDLLGFDEPGKSGAKPETLGMWNVLWVQQGQSFGALDLPDSARSNLHSALESEVGEVLGGKRGRALPDAVDKKLSELVTSTGRPRGDYKELIDEVETMRSELEGLKSRRSDLSKTLEDLEAEQETLARLSSEEQDQKVKQELDAARTRHGELAKLESRIEAATTDVELKKRNLEQAEQAQAERRDLKEQVKTDAEAVDAAKEKLNEVRQTDRELRKQVEGLRKDTKKAEDGVTEADKTVLMARRVLTAVQRDGRIRELQERYEKAKEAEKKQRAAQQGAAVIFVTDENIEAIRDAARKLETARSRLSAAATLVSFDMPSNRLSKIEVDGATLAADQTSVEAVEGTTITIPDYGSISVQPAIKDRDRLITQQRDANDALKASLEECGVKSVGAAEEQLAKREKLLRGAELARQEAALHAPATDDYDAGAEPLADHIAGLKTIHEGALTDLGIGSLPTEKEAEQALASAQESAQEARDTLTTARAALGGPEEEMGRIQTELGSVKTRYDDGRERLEKLKKSLTEAEEQTSDDDLDAGVSVARKELADQEKAVSELEDRREGETLPQLEARISRLETALQERRDKRSGLNEKIIGLRSHIEALEGAGLDEDIQQKAREVELADDQLQRYEREVSVLTLLLSTLRSAETEAKERYLSPVLKRVRPYLQLLFPGAEIAIDENLHIVGVVRENGYEESFEHLSMGTQEQIAVLVRLAFAEMLVEQGHPATVVLDDALVFSDDRRMGRMFDILNIVGQQVQIIVLTCREQLFEGIGGRHLSLRAVKTEELVSA